MKRLTAVTIILLTSSIVFWGLGIYYHFKIHQAKRQMETMRLEMEKRQRDYIEETAREMARLRVLMDELNNQLLLLNQKMASSPARPASNSNGPPNAVVFTFDDGPFRTYEPGNSVEHTELILNILKKENIKAAFFVLGSQFDSDIVGAGETYQQYQKWLKRMVADGHTIAVHDYKHIHYSEQGRVQLAQSLDYTRRRIKEITGQEASLYVRSPGGRLSPESENYLKSKGYRHVHWNINGEVLEIEPVKYLNHLKDEIAKGRRGIILMHDRNASVYLQALIDFLKANRIPVISLEEWERVYPLPATPMTVHKGTF